MFIVKEGTPADKIGEGTPPEVLESFTKFLEKSGRVIRTTEQDTDFVKTKVQAEVDKAYGTQAKQFDSILNEVTGFNKLDTEKTTDYAKRAITEKLKLVGELQKELKELKDKGADGNVLAQEYKGQIAQLQSQIKSLNDEKVKEVETLKGQIFESNLSARIEHAFAEIRASLGIAGLDPKLMDDIIAARMIKFRSENKAKEFDGILVWTDQGGNVKNSKQNGKPLSTKEVLEPYFGDLVDKGKKQGGAGSGEGDGGQGDAKWKTLTLPSSVQSKAELYKWLRDDNKMDENTKDFNDAYQSLGVKLPIERKR